MEPSELIHPECQSSPTATPPSRAFYSLALVHLYSVSAWEFLPPSSLSLPHHWQTVGLHLNCFDRQCFSSELKEKTNRIILRPGKVLLHVGDTHFIAQLFFMLCYLLVFHVFLQRENTNSMVQLEVKNCQFV